MTAAARLDALPLEELEEEVIFSEWRALRAVKIGRASCRERV